MSLYKQKLVSQVAKAASLSQKDTHKVVKALLEGVQSGLQKDGEVQIFGFGTFFVRSLPGRAGRNPRTGEKLQLPASRKVAFRYGKDLVKAVNGE